MLGPFGTAIFVILLLTAGYFFVMGLVELYLKVTVGRPIKRTDRVLKRLRGVLVDVLGQRRLLRDAAGGIMHVFIFWGGLVFALGIIHLMLENVLNIVVVRSPYFYLITDFFGLLLLVGMVFSAFRRYVQRVPRLDVGGWREERFIILLISTITVMVAAYFVSYGFKAAVRPEERFSLAFLTQLLAHWFGGVRPSLAGFLALAFWWMHMVAAFFLVAVFRYSPLIHPVVAPLNIFFRFLGPKGGRIEPINFEEERETFGVHRLEDYTWKDILDVYACAECGRCQEKCPAFVTGKPLSPKKLLAKMKEHLEETAPKLKLELKRGRLVWTVAKRALDPENEGSRLVGGVIGTDEIWACTTCRACRQQCPNLNEHVHKIIGLRRALVLDESDFPGEAQQAFTGMERNFNPWGIAWTARADWAADLGVKVVSEADSGVEYLYFVGCAGAFDDRIKRVSTALVKVLQAAGVSFGILGTAEKCCGDSARRLGNEYLFQNIVQENIETMSSHGVKKIITACPHCFNTLKNEYPQFGGNFEVIHHTQLISQLFSKGKIKILPRGERLRLTYHDSCYLGRYNDEYRAPRHIMRILYNLSLVEMGNSKEKAFCCGAGGGRMWLEEHHGKRINIERTEQALAVNPQAIACNCPFCLTMFEDGLKDKGVAEEIKVYDVVELVARVLA